MTQYNASLATIPPSDMPFFAPDYPVKRMSDLFAHTRTAEHTPNEHWKILLKLAWAKGELHWKPFLHRTLFPRIAKQVDDEYGTRVMDASTAVYDCLHDFGYDGVVLDCPSGFVVFFVEQSVHTNMLDENRISDLWLSSLDDMVDTCALIVESHMFLNNTKSWGCIYAYNLKTAENWWLNDRNLYHLSPTVTAQKGAFLLHSALSAVKQMDRTLE